MTRMAKRFLLLEFPLAALIFALIAQAFSWALSNVPMRRDRTDDMALAVSSDPTAYRIIVLADSITRNATARFSLGEPGEVANLATHANFGVAGELMLLQRYLDAHPAPKHVVVAFSPAMYGWVSNIRIVRYNLWNAFRRDSERRFLKTYLPDIEGRDRIPAAADFQESIVEPFFSLLKGTYLALRGKGVIRIASGSLDPHPDAATDARPVDPDVLEERLSEGLRTIPAPINTAALARLCTLSEQRGFRVNFAWPPMASEIEHAIVASGELAELESSLRSIMTDRCRMDEIFDFNKIRTYTISNFHRDMMHLFGEGWEQRYASDLRGYLNSLSD